MTTRPKLATDVNYVNGLAAVALFAVLAWTFITAELPIPQGFGEGSITKSIGFAMFDMLDQIPAGHGETEGFLVAFLLIAIVLDAALDGAVLLARREEEESLVRAMADGGRRILDDESASEHGEEYTQEHETASDGGDD